MWCTDSGQSRVHYNPSATPQQQGLQAPLPQAHSSLVGFSQLTFTMGYRQTEQQFPRPSWHPGCSQSRFLHSDLTFRLSPKTDSLPETWVFSENNNKTNTQNQKPQKSNSNWRLKKKINHNSSVTELNSCYLRHVSLCFILSP